MTAPRCRVLAEIGSRGAATLGTPGVASLRAKHGGIQEPLWQNYFESICESSYFFLRYDRLLLGQMYGTFRGWPTSFLV